MNKLYSRSVWNCVQYENGCTDPGNRSKNPLPGTNNAAVKTWVCTGGVLNFNLNFWGFRRFFLNFQKIQLYCAFSRGWWSFRAPLGRHVFDQRHETFHGVVFVVVGNVDRLISVAVRLGQSKLCDFVPDIGRVQEVAESDGCYDVPGRDPADRDVHGDPSELLGGYCGSSCSKKRTLEIENKRTLNIIYRNEYVKKIWSWPHGVTRGCRIQQNTITKYTRYHGFAGYATLGKCPWNNSENLLTWSPPWARNPAIQWVCSRDHMKSKISKNSPAGTWNSIIQ